MSIDIAKLIRKLAAQGDTTHNTLRTLKATYYRTALDLLEIYHNDAKINGLDLNINEEEIAIELFANNIIIAGQDFLDNPNQNPLITNWNRVETAMPEIKTRFLDIVESDSKILRDSSLNVGQQKSELEKRVTQHLGRIYKDVLNQNDINQMSENFLSHVVESQKYLPNHITEEGESWSEKTIVLITYADTLQDQKNLPINSIHKFKMNTVMIFLR